MRKGLLGDIDRRSEHPIREIKPPGDIVEDLRLCHFALELIPPDVKIRGEIVVTIAKGEIGDAEQVFAWALFQVRDLEEVCRIIETGLPQLAGLFVDRQFGEPRSQKSIEVGRSSCIGYIE